MIAKQTLFNTTITAITNLIGTVRVGRVTTSQFPVGTNEELATIGRLLNITRVNITYYYFSCLHKSIINNINLV